MRQFWRENEKRLFSAKEAQLYFFLLSEYNRLHRENPYLCSTQRIANNLGISRQTLCRLREKLQVRGLLTYKEGKNLSATPCYSLLLKSDSLIEPRNGTQDGAKEAQEEAQDGTQDGTINKIEKRDKIIYNSITGDELVPLEELYTSLLNNSEWLMKVSEFATSRGVEASEERIRELLTEFFLYLQTCGNQPKAYNDAQRHFVNWLTKRKNCCASRRKTLTAQQIGVKLTDNSPEKFKNVTEW